MLFGFGHGDSAVLFGLGQGDPTVLFGFGQGDSAIPFELGHPDRRRFERDNDEFKLAAVAFLHATSPS